jgi:hypothetical protein
MIPKPILVTGAHRSGSTWIGKVIASSPQMLYIHEPFNIGIQRKNSPLKYWNECITEGTPMRKQKKVLDYIKYFYALPKLFLREEFSKVHSINQFRDFIWICRQRINNRTVLKDPIAIFSTEWIYGKTDCDVVISIRHPAAFVASLLVKEWGFDFNNFLEQDELIETYLKSYRSEIEQYAKERQDIVLQGILLWNCIYDTVYQYQQKYGDKWLFIKHEDISLRPVESFEKIFKGLNLEFVGEVHAYIKKTTESDKETLLERDSKKNIETWKQRLSTAQIEQIKTMTSEVWQRFYKEEDWS